MSAEGAKICGGEFVPWKEAFAANSCTCIPPQQWTPQEQRTAIQALGLNSQTDTLVNIATEAPWAFELGHYEQLISEMNRLDDTTQFLIGAVVASHLGFNLTAS